MEITATEDGVRSISFKSNSGITSKYSKITNVAVHQLEAYFRGELQEFDLPLSPEGSLFYHSVWNELRTIPYGSTSTYSSIAVALNAAKAVRAVGRANGENPIAIVVPCHRVIGADGSLTGYAGELWRKRWLLHHEARIAGTLLL